MPVTFSIGPRAANQASSAPWTFWTRVGSAAETVFARAAMTTPVKTATISVFIAHFEAFARWQVPLYPVASLGSLLCSSSPSERPQRPGPLPIMTRIPPPRPRGPS